MYPSIPDEATVLRGPFVTGFSDDEFFGFCQENDLARIERTANHEIIITPPAGFESSAAGMSAAGLLFMWCRQFRQGRVLESSVGYTLPDGAVLSPDASWVSSERLATVTVEHLQKFPPLCPDFVIEVKRLPTAFPPYKLRWNNGSTMASNSVFSSTLKPKRPTCTAPASPSKRCPASTRN